MGLFDLFKGKKKDPGPRVLVLRDADVARTIPSDFPGHGPRRGAQGACECGAELVEVLVTTGGPGSDPELWRMHPIAVDGWICEKCHALRLSRFHEPEESVAIGRDAVAAVERGDFDAAELGFRRIVSSWPDYRPGHVDLAQAMLERWTAEALGPARPFVEAAILDRAEAQLTRARRLEAPPADGFVVAKLVEVYLARDQPHRARALIEEERALGSVPAEELDGFAQRVAFRGDLFDRGIAAIRPHLRFHGARASSLDAATRARVERGARDLAAHVKAKPDSWQPLFFMGKAYEALRDDDAAIAAFERAFAIAPDRVEIGKEYGRQLLDAGRSREAVDIASRTCALAPKDAALVANLAVAQMLAGELAAARATAERAAALDPADPINENIIAFIDAVERGERRLPRSLREIEGR